MIGKVCKRGSDVRRLLGYLFREGLAGEHGLTAPHTAARLIAGWEGPAGLEPAVTAGGGRDLRQLVATLNAPLLAGGLERQEWKKARPVYHRSRCSSPMTTDTSSPELCLARSRPIREPVPSTWSGPGPRAPWRRAG